MCASLIALVLSIDQRIHRTKMKYGGTQYFCLVSLGDYEKSEHIVAFSSKWEHCLSDGFAVELNKVKIVK